jgi:ribosomal protein L11 methylase PrmA
VLPAGAAAELSWRWQEDEDWAREWKQGLGRAASRSGLVVKPTWCAFDARPGEW